jgi:hypothetical protein
MATRDFTENESLDAHVLPAASVRNTPMTVMVRIGQSDLYLPCLIQMQFRRDGKGYRIVRKELFAAPILKESI